MRIDEDRALNRNRDRAGRRSDGCLPGRCNFRTGEHLDVLHLAGIDLDGSLRCRSAGSHVLPAHRRYSIRLVDVGNVINIGDVVYGHVVHVVILHVDGATLLNIGDVDLVDVAGAGPIPGMVSLARTQREPG